MKLKQWFYSLFRLRFTYTIDAAAKVATIRTNKPPELLSGVENEEVDTLSAHFATQGYHVIIRNY
jgi:hypothetical protein